MSDDRVMDIVIERTKYRVYDGLFVGMDVAPEVCWSEIDRPSKLLGTYEQELHPFLSQSKRKRYDCVIDVGCAEGYYAVGLALNYPSARVLAYDSNAAAQALCQKNAVLNMVHDRVVIGSHCDPAELVAQIAKYQRSLVVCDCEGYETTLFADPATRLALGNVDLVIECHDFIDSTSTKTIFEYFAHSHNSSILYSGSRNPNVVPFLKSCSDMERWRAVCEYRPALMSWVICESRRWG